MATAKRAERRIRYKFKRTPGVWGRAFPEQWRIEIDPSLDDKTLLDIAVHEAEHVLHPDICEETINRNGIVIADLLWRLGYRRTNEDE